MPITIQYGKATGAMTDKDWEILCQRIQARLDYLELKPSAVSKAATGTVDTIRNIMRGFSKTPKHSTLKRLAIELKCTVEYLTGEVPYPEDDNGTEPVPPDKHRVPILTDIEAGRWATSEDPFPMGGSDESVLVGEGFGKRCFALKIKGRSMEPEFVEGDIVIIDPDVQPNPGECVAAKRASDDKVTFKKYRPRGLDENRNEIIELAPINPDYPPLRIDAQNPGKIVGTLVEHRRKRRV